MSTETHQQEVSPPAGDGDSAMQDVTQTKPTPAQAGNRRPRLDLSVLAGDGVRGERKRGKSMFGVLVNTLNKAKAEDKERNASEAAKKRQLIDQRLQNKLKKDADLVRQVEEAKKDKITATRKEEELQVKDSVYKLRRTRLPLLSNFLLTSDVIQQGDADMDTSQQIRTVDVLPPRSHPPPLYYLPSILTPEQEAFIARRKAQVKEAAENEWESFKNDRSAGVEEIMNLRQKVNTIQKQQENETEDIKSPTKDNIMDVDEGRTDGSRRAEVKEESAPGDDDAVEY